MAAQPVTHAELLEALSSLKQELLGALVQKQEMHQALAAQNQEILQVMRGEFARQGERNQEIVRDAQTEILKAFLPTQEAYNIRFRTFEATDAGLSDRMAVVERRLQEIEKRLLMRPPAA